MEEMFYKLNGKWYFMDVQLQGPSNKLYVEWNIGLCRDGYKLVYETKCTSNLDVINAKNLKSKMFKALKRYIDNKNVVIG